MRAMFGRWLLGLGLGLFVAGAGCEELEGLDLEGEGCDYRGELSPCGRPGEFNVCDVIDERLQWGECHAVECTPGTTDGCGSFGVATCEISDGVPFWECVEEAPAG